MKLFIRRYLLILLLINSLMAQAQQDINFSQFYELPLLRNPALAGIFNGNVRFTAAYRNQWQSVTTPYRTMAVSGEVKFFKGFSTGDFTTLGLQITNDAAGDSRLHRTQVLPVLNYHKLLNEETNTYIALAFMGGPVSEGFDPGKLQFDDQFVNGAYSASNPTSQTFNRTHFTYMDASTGLSFTSVIRNNAKFYLGAGMFHFTNPKLSFMMDNDVRLNRKWVFNTGVSAYTNTFNRIVIYADYFMQGANRLTQGGFLFTHNFDADGDESKLSLSGGIAYRYKDAMIPVIKINTNDLNIGLSYDVNVSKLKTASVYRGGFELTLSYVGLWNKENSDAEKVHCPIKLW